MDVFENHWIFPNTAIKLTCNEKSPPEKTNAKNNFFFPHEEEKFCFSVNMQGENLQSNYKNILKRKIITSINLIDGITYYGNNLSIRREIMRKNGMFEEICRHIVQSLTKDHPYWHIQATMEMIGEGRDIPEEILPKIHCCDDDESEFFYSCRICQSLAPKHICIIRPQHIGLCGHIGIDEAEFFYRTNPYGAVRRIEKGKEITPGQWTGVNREIQEGTFGQIKKVCCYDILQFPHTISPFSQGLAALMPDIEGIILLTGKYKGPTPLGLTFEELMNLVIHNGQTEGVTGFAIASLQSKRFLQNNKAALQIRWMPSLLGKITGLTTYNEQDATDIDTLKKLTGK